VIASVIYLQMDRILSVRETFVMGCGRTGTLWRLLVLPRARVEIEIVVVYTIGQTGVISTTNSHRGFFLDLAYMSQRALSTAPVAI